MTPRTSPSPPPRRTQEERRAEAEQRLLAAAAQLISETGPASLTLAKVGERAGYSRGLATHHFGSKAALMQRVADAVSRDFAAALERERREPHSVLDALMALVDVYFDIIVDPPPINRARLVLIADAVAHSDADSREVVLAADRQFRVALARRLASASDRGELTDDELDGLAVTVVGLLRGIAFESMLDPTIDLSSSRSQVQALLESRFSPTHPHRPGGTS